MRRGKFSIMLEIIQMNNMNYKFTLSKIILKFMNH